MGEVKFHFLRFFSYRGSYKGFSLWNIMDVICREIERVAACNLFLEFVVVVFRGRVKVEDSSRSSSRFRVASESA